MSPIGITVYWYSPLCVMKAVFHRSAGHISNWWYPDFKSILDIYFEPVISSKMSSARGSGKATFLVMALMRR